jgi:hypothetical protein
VQGVDTKYHLGYRSVLNSAVPSGMCIAARLRSVPPKSYLSLIFPSYLKLAACSTFGAHLSMLAGGNGLTLITSQDVLYSKLLNTSGLYVYYLP